jgi:hypothetical protein
MLGRLHVRTGRGMRRNLSCIQCLASPATDHTFSKWVPAAVADDQTNSSCTLLCRLDQFKMPWKKSESVFVATAVGWYKPTPGPARSALWLASC